MRSHDIEVDDPGGDLGAWVVQVEDQRLFEKLVAYAAVEARDEAGLHGFPGAMKCQSMPLSRQQKSMALQVNSMP